MANNLATIDIVTRSVIFKNSNRFLVGFEYDAIWFEEAAELPLAQISLTQAVALGVAAAIIKNPIVSRRFWGNLNVAR